MSITSFVHLNIFYQLFTHTSMQFRKVNSNAKNNPATFISVWIVF